MLGLFLHLGLGQVYWAKRIWDYRDEDEIDGYMTLLATSDGNLLVMATVMYWDEVNRDGYPFLLKVSPSGSVLWKRVFWWPNNDYQDYDYGDVVEAGGGYIVFAGDNSNTDTLSQWVLKVSSSGSLQWAYRYWAKYNTADYSLQLHSADVLSDGNIVAVGESEYAYDGFIAKLSTTGSPLWARAYDGIPDRFWRVIATSDGGFLAVGEEDDVGFGDDDILLAKFSSSGSLQWSELVGGPGDDYDYVSVAQAPDGGYFLAFESTSWSSPSGVVVAKLTSSGAVSWAKLLTDPSGSYSLNNPEVLALPDGRCVVVFERTESYCSDVKIVKFTSSGSLSFSKWIASSSGNFRGPENREGGPKVALLNGDAYAFVQTGDWYIGLVKFNPNTGDNCVAFDWSPVVQDVSVGRTSQSLGTLYTPPLDRASISLSTFDPDFYVVEDACDTCAAVGVRESFAGRSSVSCLGLKGALLLRSSARAEFAIYEPSGALVRKGVVEGEVKVPLKRGVYLWVVGRERGAVVVR